MKKFIVEIEMEIDDESYTTKDIRNLLDDAFGDWDLGIKKLAIREMVNSECICPSTCKTDCRGQCGCKYCHDAYQDFLSLE